MSTNNHKQSRTVYIPQMCDHAFVLAAALRAEGMPGEVLPPSDDETMAIGLDLCKGSECSPCFTTTGDIIRRARQPGFDPAQAAFLMPTAAGACRFGQYANFQRNIFEQMGLGEMEVLSPSAANSYHGFGDNPTRLRLIAWQGVVALDLLQKLTHHYRPYELNRGQADELYQAALERIVAAAEGGAGKPMRQVMQWVADRFEALPVDRSEPRPLIGVLGEIYLRFNTYSNMELIRRVEAAGGEVMLASMMEFLYFTGWFAKVKTWRRSHYLGYLQNMAADLYQKYHERRLARPLKHLLPHPYEESLDKLMDRIRPYYEPVLGTEAVLSIGKALEMAEHRACGLINVMPFSCMPGILTAGIAPRLRADLDNIPWLDISYDAQGGTNINTRLEAFMYQAEQFRRRQAG